MKKILLLTFVLFISMEVFADCVFFDRSTCPKTVCPSGTLMGDDDKCYDCNTREDIHVACLGEDIASKKCPNRIFLDKGCSNDISRLCPKNTCPPSTFMGDDGKCYDCDEEKEIDINCIGEAAVDKTCLNRTVSDCYGNLSFKKCKDGFERSGHNQCEKSVNEGMRSGIIYGCPIY